MRVSCAVGAAEHMPVDFLAMADDHAPTVLTFRRQPMDRAFKTVKSMLSAIRGPYDECLVIVVSANFAFGHVCLQIHIDTGKELISRPGLAKRSGTPLSRSPGRR
jgi:hypothetical protein